MAGKEVLRRPRGVMIHFVRFALLLRLSFHEVDGMLSPKRVHRRNFNLPGHAHELTFSCYHNFEFLKAERTCLWLIEAIDTARQKHDVAVWAYVFMPDHVHLLICPRQAEYDIAAIRQTIKEPVARKAVRYLKRHSPEWLSRITVGKGEQTRSQFWQKGGGYDRNITEPATLQKMIDYIHRKPVRRGFVERATDWKWSSAGWFAGGGESPLKMDQIPLN